MALCLLGKFKWGCISAYDKTETKDMDYRFLIAPNNGRGKKRVALQDLVKNAKSQRINVGSRQAGPLAFVLGTFAQLKH